MGCCQSDLKGDEQAGTSTTTNDTPAIKKVQTNFSTIDYDAAASERRDTIYAPHEAERAKSDALSPGTERKTDPISQEISEGTAGTSAHHHHHPESEGAKFENKLPDQPTNPHIVTETDAHKAPYHDVTASPTTPAAANQIDEKFHTPAATPAVEHPPQTTH